MGNLNKKLAEESNLNRKLYDRRRGEHINYGEEIQLLHYDSKSFLEGSKNCSEIDKSCNLVRLNA
jgi:Inositol 1,4,5-trisphosphate/ryanodine receptor